MAQSTVEERLDALETIVRELSARVCRDEGTAKSWKRIVGVYKDDPAFDGVERIGKEWRESFRPTNDVVAPL